MNIVLISSSYDQLVSTVSELCEYTDTFYMYFN